MAGAIIAILIWLPLMRLGIILARSSTRRFMQTRNFYRGDPAPWFVARSTDQPHYRFDTIAGRYVVLCFLGAPGQPGAKEALRVALIGHRALFDDRNACLLVVSTDPDDERLGRLRQSPGVRPIWDFDRTVSRLYGAAAGDDPSQDKSFWLVLDPMLRVLRQAPLEQAEQVMAYLATLPPSAVRAGAASRAPVLVLPDVFEPRFCQHLIGLYRAQGGEQSGFMLEVDGQTVKIEDKSFKQRRDHQISHDPTRVAIRERIEVRLLPEVWKSFQFTATRLERYIVACYDAGEGGHFQAHRDNTTPGTAHRRFAVTINLNDDYEGGDLRFPEFGPHGYRGPVGGAIVFSCALLHEVTPVTRGVRYATLPFLYDEAAVTQAEILAEKAE
jgi:predicted 2-oxoglutarate/Fe(II)-dependent dioxygenase YbiX